jgi:hypothetical protein
MNELQILVQQNPGVISTNFDDIKTKLSAQMQIYKELEVTEENKPERKKDIATLRKMTKAVNDKKVEIKNEFMKPYTVFEENVKALIEIINEPIGILDNQVKEFEEKQRLQKQTDIKAAFDVIIAGYTDLIDEIGLITIYDNRWENATASMKSVKEDITAKLEKIHNDVTLIKSMVSEKAEEALSLFWGDLDVTKAVTMINRYKAQKHEIEKKMQEQQRLEKERELERERERVREEERARIREEEKIREEERRKVAEAEERIREEERLATEKRLMGIKAPADPVDLEAPFDADESPFVVPGDLHLKMAFTVIGTPFELQQVEMYMNSIGLLFERRDIDG